LNFQKLLDRVVQLAVVRSVLRVGGGEELFAVDDEIDLHVGLKSRRYAAARNNSRRHFALIREQ
jgi:hypothetical protein